MPRRIITIASAPGWSARFTSEDTPWEEAKVVTLALWALVEGDGSEREIVGIVQQGADEALPVGKLTFADEVEGFDGYAHAGVRTQPV
jgi:hypothetical protein